MQKNARIIRTYIRFSILAFFSVSSDRFHLRQLNNRGFPLIILNIIPCFLFFEKNFIPFLKYVAESAMLNL